MLNLKFVLLLIIAITFNDKPAQVVGGRTLFFFTIPILISGIVLRPSAGFWTAVFISIVINLLIFYEPTLHSYNFISPLGLMLIALITWIGARSLEQSLADLQESNLRLEKQSAELEAINLQLRQENIDRKRAETELTDKARGLHV